MTLMNLIDGEFKDKALIEVPFLKERLTISIGCHVVNTYNLENSKFYHIGGLENLRTHVCIMSPSGFGRSAIMKFFLDKKYGMLSSTDIDTAVRSTFSPESWMGTISKMDGSKDKDSKGRTHMKGLFSKFKTGIIGADDFMKLTMLMDGDGIRNDEVYLMTALDCDTATKDLSYGSVEETGIGTTMWAGIRVAKIGMKSGLARRFSFHMFFPTPSMAKQFRLAGRNKAMKRPVREITKQQIRSEIISIQDQCEFLKDIDYSPIEKYINGDMTIPHFEECIYKRMALGYAAVTGTLPDIILDDRLRGILENEKDNRRIIRGDPSRELIIKIIDDEKKIEVKELTKFLTHYYQYNKYSVRGMIHYAAIDGRIIKKKEGRKEYLMIKK